MDNMLISIFCTIKTTTDEGVYEYIINKDWSNDFFVKLIKNRILLYYYKFTGQNDKYQGILDRMLADSITSQDTIFGVENVELFNGGEVVTDTDNIPLPLGDGNGDAVTEGNPVTPEPTMNTVTNRGVFWGDINKFKYMFIDSPALRTSIALTAFFIVKYSTTVLIQTIIN